MVHHRPRVLTVFRGVVAGLDTEFLKRIWHGERLIDIRIFIDVIAAVELVTDLILPCPIDRDGHRAGKGFGYPL